MQSMTVATTDVLRNAELNDLVGLLRTQADVKYDVVVNAATISYEHGLFVVADGAARVTEDGVGAADARLRPTRGCEDQLAEKLGIPARYVRRMRDDAVARSNVEQPPLTVMPVNDEDVADLLDRNVNHWLLSNPGQRLMIRAFRTDDPDEIGIARAVLSDRFGMIDNLDVLMAGLDGVRQAEADVTIDRCDLTERSMQVRFSAPNVQALAPLWLQGYRSPFDEDGNGGTLHRAAARGRHGDVSEMPVVYAGLVLSNSETGGGAFQIAPQVIVEWCKNGATMKADAMREIHLGGRLDEGVVRWSDSTQRKSVELITAKARDAVATFLDVDYLTRAVERIEEKAGAPVKEPTKVIERVGKRFGFTQTEQDTILSAFITSGQSTAGGVLQAVTATAQTLDDADRAAELEGVAMDVLDFVAVG